MANGWDVIVVGAGIAGLTTAYRLKQRLPTCKVLVLEAKDRVGGRTFSTELQGASGKDTWDLGGQWVGSTQHHILWLMDELGLEKYPQYTEGRKQMLLGNKSSIRTYTSSTPSLSLLGTVDLYRFINHADNLAKTVCLEDPMKTPNAKVLDGTTVDSLMRQKTWSADGRDAISVTIEMLFGVSTTMMSALYFLHYIRSAGNLSNLIESVGDANNAFKIKGGTQQISTLLAGKIGWENVLPGKPVVHIDQVEAESVTVVTADGKRFTSRLVVVATPLHCSTDIKYTPLLPLERIGLARHSPVGHLLKFIVTYQTTFWRDDGYSGEIVSRGGPATQPDVSSGPLCLTYDCTTPNGNPAIVGFFANSRQWSQIDPEARKNAILESLVTFLGPKARDALDYCDKDWALEPYNGGCPVNVMTPGTMTYFYKGLLTPFGRVYWAGTETATHHRGYINGAVQSGMRAADEIMCQLEPDHGPDAVLTELDKKPLP